MLRSEAITIIKRGLGFRQTQDAAIVAALKQVQRDFETGATLPEWMVVYAEPQVVSALTGTAPLPAGFLRLHEEYPAYFLNTSGGKVYTPRKNATEAKEAYPAPATDGYPRVMVVQGSALAFVPPPTVDTTIYLTYYRAEPTLDSDIENGWLKNAANYLVGVAGVMVAADLRDKGAMDKFNLMAKSGYKSYIGGVVDDELMGRPLIMGRNN